MVLTLTFRSSSATRFRAESRELAVIAFPFRTFSESITKASNTFKTNTLGATGIHAIDLTNFSLYHPTVHHLPPYRTRNIETTQTTDICRESFVLANKHVLRTFGLKIRFTSTLLLCPFHLIEIAKSYTIQNKNQFNIPIDASNTKKYNTNEDNNRSSLDRHSSAFFIRLNYCKRCLIQLYDGYTVRLLDKINKKKNKTKIKSKFGSALAPLGRFLNITSRLSNVFV